MQLVCQRPTKERKPEFGLLATATKLFCALCNVMNQSQCWNMEKRLKRWRQQQPLRSLSESNFTTCLCYVQRYISPSPFDAPKFCSVSIPVFEDKSIQGRAQNIWSCLFSPVGQQSSGSLQEETEPYVYFAVKMLCVEHRVWSIILKLSMRKT